MTSPHNLNQLVSSVAKQITQNEKFSIALLNLKIEKLAHEYPNDYTLGSVAQILARAGNNKKAFITRAELNDIYNRFYTRNTKFGQLFQEELGIDFAPEIRREATVEPLPISDIHSSVADPTLAGALATVFDQTQPYRPYAPEQAKKAQALVNQVLSVWNLTPNKLTADSGNEHFIVVRADYDTPKGSTGVLVPVEVQKGKVLEPTFFVGNAGPYELNHTNLKAYIVSQAGQNLRLKSAEVMQILNNSVYPKAEISEVEMALTKLNADKATPQPFAGASILGQKLETLGSEVQVPKSPEFESFAEKLSTPAGIAEMQFGRAKIELGADAVRRSLTQYGVAHSVIKVADCSENTVFYAVSANNGNFAITVPVKFTNSRVQVPEVFICNGNVSALDAKSLQKALVAGKADARAAVITSPHYGLKPSELIENIRLAMSECNFGKAEDALNVLKGTGDAKAYGIAFAIYKDGLAARVASTPEAQCSMIIQSKNSQYDLCGHTGLPLHKIYVDKYGSCQPLYRKGMDETTEELYLMHSKIFG
jgi:hypothetical protein